MNIKCDNHYTIWTWFLKFFSTLSKYYNCIAIQSEFASLTPSTAISDVTLCVDIISILLLLQNKHNNVIDRKIKFFPIVHLNPQILRVNASALCMDEQWHIASQEYRYHSSAALDTTLRQSVHDSTRSQTKITTGAVSALFPILV